MPADEVDTFIEMLARYQPASLLTMLKSTEEQIIVLTAALDAPTLYVEERLAATVAYAATINRAIEKKEDLLCRIGSESCQQ